MFRQAGSLWEAAKGISARGKEPTMGLYCGIDLHSNNAVYAVTDGEDQVLFRR